VYECVRWGLCVVRSRKGRDTWEWGGVKGLGGAAKKGKINTATLIIDHGNPR